MNSSLSCFTCFNEFVESKSPWFEQRSSFISLEDIMVGVQFTPHQRAFMVLRFAETHSAVQVQQEFRRNIINNVYSLKHVKHDKDEFIRYNCSQQIDNVNNTHLLGCCLS